MRCELARYGNQQDLFEPKLREVAQTAPDVRVDMSSRVNFDFFENSFARQEKKWYIQGDRPTCVAWAIGNATQALDSPLPEELLRLLHARAHQKDGVRYLLSQSVDLAENFCDIRVGDIRLKHFFNLFYPGLDTASPGRDMNASKSSPSGKKAREEKKAARRIRTINGNGLLLVSALQEGGIPVVMVRNGLFKRGKDDGKASHALTVVGYRITADSYLDIQYVDSNVGLSAFTSIENLSESLFPDPKHNAIYVSKVE